MIHDPRQLWLLDYVAQRRAPRELGFRGVQVLAYIRHTIATTGQAPSYTEIMRELDFSDRADVCRVVKRLEARGIIRRVGSGRVRRIRLPSTPTITGNEG